MFYHWVACKKENSVNYHANVSINYVKTYHCQVHLDRAVNLAFIAMLHSVSPHDETIKVMISFNHSYYLTYLIRFKWVK